MSSRISPSRSRSELKLRLRASAIQTIAVLSACTLTLLLVRSESEHVGARKLASALTDEPWEISTPQGERVLPDIFYADPTENEQVLPTSVRVRSSSGRFDTRVEIDNLIYPTLGNPNLYIRSDLEDSLMVVLRIDKSELMRLPLLAASIEGERDLDVELTPAFLSAIRLSLSTRAERQWLEMLSRPMGAGVPLLPTRVLLHAESEGMPAALAERATLKFYFGQNSLAALEPGLYDLRLDFTPEGRFEHAEFQYNAVRIFDQAPERGEYSVLNVTDTQIALSDRKQGIFGGESYRALTYNKLRDWVRFVRTTDDPQVRGAQFITFNGDLHNGGSPITFKQEEVATLYQSEAALIVETLRDLPIPIFLVPGNHDGYASFGHVPPVAKLFGGKSLKQIVTQAVGAESWKKLERYTRATRTTPAGVPRDVFLGRYVKRPKMHNGMRDWKELPQAERNLALYDGFYQWRRTYGPLYTSWIHGKNQFINVNSFDLRQHRRSGWAMFTLNYGGGVSPWQMEWLERELERADALKNDVILLAHHDPRGGHSGHDYPYYFKQLDYRGVLESIVRYVDGEVLNPTVCEKLPESLMSKKKKLSCLHDGNQEWMRADPQFDCENEYLIRSGPKAGECDQELFLPTIDNRGKRHPTFSGFQMIHLFASNPRLRTVLLGHTHYNSVEMLQSGDALIPEKLVADFEQGKYFARLERSNPVRSISRRQELGISESTRSPSGGRKRPEGAEPNGEPLDLEGSGIVKDDQGYYALLLRASHQPFSRVIEDKELAILRLTSGANLSDQDSIPDGMPFFGFSVLDVLSLKDAREYENPQINRVTYYQGGLPGGGFRKVTSIELDRTARIKRGDPKSDPLYDLMKMSREKRP